MGRKKSVRVVETPPMMKGYSPFGISCPKREKVVLNIEEYEAVRLIDYMHLKQAEAAEQMNVSRPTLTRIYDKARSKIATAFVEGKEIFMEGGAFEYTSVWYRCKRCHRIFKETQEHKPCNGCKFYGSDELETL
ncbi:DUF134 domain-containing protein [Halosquirtibacter xylanolyticus]|uniref:DUF134 domain-containing protein n=1 Tax=Halosquirtibacter xylanolyticus TaxID=3374599 RepID=UPI0037495106|nr:DUF134 domain-containing protein [Prolixibacteraceae bacterium]